MDIMIGYVKSAFGVNGWIKIQGDPINLEFAAKHKKITLIKMIDNSQVQITSLYCIKHSYMQRNILYAQLDSIIDRDMAISLKSAKVYLNKNAITISDDEFYWKDLISMRVVNLVGHDFGLVHSLLSTGAHDVLVVHNLERQYLIPFVKKFIINVDMQNKLLHIDWELDF